MCVCERARHCVSRAQRSRCGSGLRGWYRVRNAVDDTAGAAPAGTAPAPRPCRGLAPCLGVCVTHSRFVIARSRIHIATNSRPRGHRRRDGEEIQRISFSPRPLRSICITGLGSPRSQLSTQQPYAIWPLWCQCVWLPGAVAAPPSSSRPRNLFQAPSGWLLSWPCSQSSPWAWPWPCPSPAECVWSCECAEPPRPRCEAREDADGRPPARPTAVRT